MTEIVLERPSKLNSALWICTKCSLYMNVDYAAANPQQMYDHMQQHYQDGEEVPGGIFTQLEEAIREKVVETQDRSGELP